MRPAEPGTEWSPHPGVRVLPLRTPTLPPATHTNSVLLGRGELLLVEPGPTDASEVARLDAWLAEAHSRGERVVACVPTHHHADHIGALTHVHSLGIPIWAHADTARRLGVPVARELGDSERLQLGGLAVTVLHTPGHAPGHLVLDLPDAEFSVVGDMVASIGTILIEPGDGDMGLYLASLGRLAELGRRRVVPAHGRLIEDGPAHYRSYIAHRREREARVARALSLRAEPARPSELVPEVYDDVPSALWPLAALSLEAHLLHLVESGLAARAPGSLDARFVARDKRP